MKNYLFLTLLCILLAGIISCHKENDIQIATLDGQITGRTPGDPYIYDDRLTFDSWQDFDDYYDYLYELNDDPGNIDSLLSIEEARSSYISLRSITEKDSFSQAELEEYYESDFIYDIYMKSILNEHYEYGIADSVFVAYDKGRTYKIEGKNTNEVAIFRNLSKGIGEIPVWSYRENITMPFYNGANLIDSKVLQPILPRSLFIRINKDVSTGNCNPRSKNLVMTAEQSYDGVTWSLATSVDWTLNWGDGTGTATFNDTEEVSASHTYSPVSGSGPFTVAITVTWWDNLTHSNIIMNESILVSVTSTCLETEYGEPDWIETLSVNYPITRYAMGIKLWYTHISREQFGALTHAWVWDPVKVKWFRRNCNISVEFDASWLESNCTVEEQINRSEDWPNRKKAQIVDRKGGDYNYWTAGEPVSEHWYKYPDWSTQTALANLTLDPCN